MVNSGTIEARGTSPGAAGGTIELAGNEISLAGTGTVDLSAGAGGQRGQLAIKAHNADINTQPVPGTLGIDVNLINQSKGDVSVFGVQDAAMNEEVALIAPGARLSI